MTGAQRGFQIHATVWFAVNAFLFLIWAMTGAGFPCSDCPWIASPDPVRSASSEPIEPNPTATSAA